MTQKKLYITFFKKKAGEWLKHDYLDLSSEQERSLLFPEIKQLPIEVLHGFIAVFYEIFVELERFDKILKYFEEDCCLRGKSLEYLLYFHNFHSAESAKVLEAYPSLEHEFYESLNRIFTLMENWLGGKAQRKLFARSVPTLIRQIVNTMEGAEKAIEQKDAVR